MFKKTSVCTFMTAVIKTLKIGHPVAHLVEALRYNPEGSIPDGVIGIFH